MKGNVLGQLRKVSRLGVKVSDCFDQCKACIFVAHQARIYRVNKGDTEGKNKDYAERASKEGKGWPRSHFGSNDMNNNGKAKSPIGKGAGRSDVITSEVPNLALIRLKDGHECNFAVEASLLQEGGPSQTVPIRLMDGHHDDRHVPIRLTDGHDDKRNVLIRLAGGHQDDESEPIH